jgi:hypothetical protein
MIAAPAMTTVELLRFHPESPSTKTLFSALHRARAVEVVNTDRYVGESEWLMVWGPGSPLRFEPMRQQLAKGRHVITWDAAYWSRERKMRVSIDRAHPQQWVMQREWPASRWLADPAPVGDGWDPDGYVIVAGLGQKARVQYGPEVVDAWEAGMVEQCRERFARVLYRPKRDGVQAPPGASLVSAAQPIDRLLQGAALVVTWHSNVAVDAIRWGIPVICQDGAARAICPPALSAKQPMPVPVSVRDRFLANLAWFQWAPAEARSCWAWLREVLA